MSRSPILDYAAYNPVTVFSEPADAITSYMVTEAGELLITEEGFAIEIEE